MTLDSRYRVREMRLDEVDLRIAYFHDASDEHLRRLGVARALLPSRVAWRQFYEADYARPIRDGDGPLALVNPGTPPAFVGQHPGEEVLAAQAQDEPATELGLVGAGPQRRREHERMLPPAGSLTV